MRDVAAPLFETTDLSGNRQRLADYKGKVVLVNIWATWCAPCRAEMPALDRLYQERKDRGFVVLGMSDESIAGAPAKVSPGPATFCAGVSLYVFSKGVRKVVVIRLETK